MNRIYKKHSTTIKFPIGRQVAAIAFFFFTLSGMSQAQCRLDLGILEIQRNGSRVIEFTSQDSTCIKDFCDRITSAPKNTPVLATIDYYFPKPSKNIILNVMAVKCILLFYGVNETKILFKFHETDAGNTSILFSGSIYK